MRIGKIPGINPVVIPITKDTITTSKIQALKIPINLKVTTSGLMTHWGAGRDKPCPYTLVGRAGRDKPCPYTLVGGAGRDKPCPYGSFPLAQGNGL